MMATPNEFKSRKAAHAYLVGRGYEVPYRTFADACAGGKCSVEKNGKTILLSSLVNYIDQHLKRSAPVKSSQADRKVELENDLLTERLEKIRLENRREDAAWMLRTEHEEQVAGILGAAQEMVRQRFDMEGPRLLHALGGDQGRLPELVSAIEETIGAAFNDLAGTHEFDVVFSGVREE